MWNKLIIKTCFNCSCFEEFKGLLNISRAVKNDNLNKSAVHNKLIPYNKFGTDWSLSVTALKWEVQNVIFWNNKQRSAWN